MHFRHYPPPAPRLLGYDPYIDVPKDHLARLVEQVVEETVGEPIQDFSDGQPAFDPRLPIKVLVFGYATGIRSSRMLERMSQESLPYLFLTRGDTPSYRTLCTARINYKEQIEEVWLGLFKIAEELGLKRMGRVTLDATKIRADTSAESVLRKNEYEVMLAVLQGILAEAEVADAQEEKTGDSGNTRLGTTIDKDQMRDILRKVRKARAQAKRDSKQADDKQADDKQADDKQADDKQTQAAGGKDSSEASAEEKEPAAKEPAAKEPAAKEPAAVDIKVGAISPRMHKRIVEGIAALEEAIKEGLKHLTLTDPDARMMGEGAEKNIKECHSFEIAVDTGLIVAALTTQVAPDNYRLEPLLEEAKKREPAGIIAVDADSGYYSGDAVASLLREGIDVCIPDSSTACDLRREQSVGTTQRQGRVDIPMVYDAASNSYTCPEGNQLCYTGTQTLKGQQRQGYRAKDSCKDCPLAKDCLSASTKRRTLSVGIHHDILQAALSAFDEAEQRERYWHRGEKVETVFGFIRSVLGYGRWCLRGKEKVKAEAELFKVAYQVRKIHKLWAPAQHVTAT